MCSLHVHGSWAVKCTENRDQTLWNICDYTPMSIKLIKNTRTALRSDIQVHNYRFSGNKALMIKNLTDSLEIGASLNAYLLRYFRDWCQFKYIYSDLVTDYTNASN